MSDTVHLQKTWTADKLLIDHVQDAERMVGEEGRYANMHNSNRPMYYCASFFRPSHIAVNMIFFVRQIQEKSIDKNIILGAVIIGLIKSINTLNRNALWIILSKLGSTDNFVSLVCQFHHNMMGN